MSKEQATIHYKLAMSVFKKWRQDGLICQEEWTRLEEVMAEKYGLSSRSIYR